MTERPIPLKDWEVRALLDGRKTQTRRVVKPQPAGKWAAPGRTSCPYGQPGDRLWVREAWQHEDGSCVNQKCGQPTHIYYRATESYQESMRWLPSIHMPRWASRLTLEITGVRVERVQEIGEEDARAEGVDWASPQFIKVQPDENPREVGYPSSGGSFARDNYRRLWDSLNAKRGCGWDANPWVWAIEFRVETHRR